jgi:hypothetical protein
LPSAIFLQQLTQALAGQRFDSMIVAAGHALIVHPARSRSLLRSLEAISSWISFLISMDISVLPGGYGNEMISTQLPIVESNISKLWPLYFRPPINA